MLLTDDRNPDGETEVTISKIKFTEFIPHCAIVARLCLIVSLWHAPIPWLHCHGTTLTEHSSPLSASQLSHHLASFHEASELNSDEEFGWHCHWILPSWIHICDRSSEDERPVNDSSEFDSIIPVQTVSSTLNSTFVAETSMLRRERQLGSIKSEFSAHRKSLVRLFVPALTIVMRC